MGRSQDHPKLKTTTTMVKMIFHSSSQTSMMFGINSVSLELKEMVVKEVDH